LQLNERSFVSQESDYNLGVQAKLFASFSKHNASKTYRGSEGKSAHILDLNTKWR